MTVRDYFGKSGFLISPVAANSLLLPVTSELSGVIAANFVNGNDATWLAVTTGSLYEMVKVLEVNGTTLVVERAQQGTLATAFPIGSKVSFVLSADSITERLNIVVNPITITGFGEAVVAEPVDNAFQITVPTPNINGGEGIDVIGTWPNIQLAYAPRGGDCCGDESSTGSGDGILEVIGEGLVIAFINGTTATIRVPPPVFNNGPNISVTGAWPNYTISATAGSGTVSSVNAGTGLQLTGSPNVNPTLAIAATGVTAGNYGGVIVNAQGQIELVPVGFNPVSTLVAGNPAIELVRVGGQITLTPRLAAIGVTGVVALADPDDDFDPTDETNAASPAVVAKALETVVSSTVAGVNSYVGEADASYTNIITASNTAVTLLVGETAIVYAEVTALDGITPATIPLLGLAVFDGSATKIKSNRIIPAANQSMQFTISGPINTSLSLVTTALAGTVSVVSYSLSILKL